MSRSAERSNLFLKYRTRSDLSRYHYHRLDMNRDAGDLLAILDDEKPDAIVNFAAQSDGVSADKIIDRLIASTPTKEDELTSDARFKKIFAS